MQGKASSSHNMQQCGAHLDYTVVPMFLLIVLAVNDLKY